MLSDRYVLGSWILMARLQDVLIVVTVAMNCQILHLFFSQSLVPFDAC